MKINLPILYDQLYKKYADRYAFFLTDCNFYDFPLQMVCLYNSRLALSHEFVYILSGKEYDRDPKRFQDSSVILIGMVKQKPVRNAILIDDPIDMIELFQETVSIFLSFEQWNQEIWTSIVSKTKLERLSKLIGGKLKNPACVLDLSFHLRSIVGELPSDRPLPSEWTDLLKHRESPVETFDIPQNDIYFFTKHEREIYKPIGSPYGNDEIFLNIYVHDSLFAILANTTLNDSFTSGEYAIMVLARNYLEQYFTSTFSATGNDTAIQYYMNLLLEGQEVNRESLKYHLSRIGWTQNASYYVCCFSFPRIQEPQKGQAEHALARLAKNMPRDIIFIYFHHVVLLSRKIDMEALAVCARKLDAICGVSFLQQDLSNIYDGYNQALLATEYARKASQETSVVSYEDYYAVHLRNALSENININQFIPSSVRNLLQFDILNHTDYVRLLKTYLICGSNSKKAGELLYMHRNTLIYRIKKIENIMSCSLDNLSISQIENILLAIWLIENP